MNKGLAIGLGVAGAAVVGGIGYVLLRRGATTPAAAAAAPPGPRLTATAPGGRTLAPPPPPGLKGVLSNYTRRDGGILYWNENEGMLYTQSGVPYVSSPTNLIVMRNYADGSPANQLVYLKGRIPHLPNGIRVMQGTPIAVNALQSWSPPPSPAPSGDGTYDAAKAAAAAYAAELARRAEEEAKKQAAALAAKGGKALSDLLGGGSSSSPPPSGDGGASASAQLGYSFTSGRWSGRGAHQMSNRPTLGFHTRMRP